jgi:hypothetical protein
MDPAIGSMVHKPLDNREVWNLDKMAYCALTQGDKLNSPNIINPLLIYDVYLVTGIDEDGYKVKITLEQICICKNSQFWRKSKVAIYCNKTCSASPSIPVGIPLKECA